MKRRTFLVGMIAAAFAPLAPAAPIASPAVVKAAGTNRLFRGELGRWDGIRIHESAITLADIDRIKASVKGHVVPLSHGAGEPVFIWSESPTYLVELRG